jgi:hypothetical protein
VKELTGMPDPASLQLTFFYTSNLFALCTSIFKSFASLLFPLQILSDEKVAGEGHHQDCMSGSNVAMQLDERDVGYKAKITKLKSQIAGLLDEKEQREGQLKNSQELLVTSEAEASETKTGLLALNEQTTRWEVEIAWLNANLSSKSSNPLLQFPNISLL